MLETRGILTLDVFECLARRVRGLTEFSQITCAASLAHHGLLGSVEQMQLGDWNLTSIPAEHLTSLVSSVTETVVIHRQGEPITKWKVCERGGPLILKKIWMIIPCDLVTIIDSVKSEELLISKQSLGSEETRALVRAMESRVERVFLNVNVDLDIMELIEYSGQGKCWRVEWNMDSAAIYWEPLNTWAKNSNWKVTLDYNSIIIEKI